MIVHPNMEQGSEEWFDIRLGRPTASRFSDIITAAKGDLSKSRGAYIAELIGECFGPDGSEFVGNAWTDRGTELEPEALELFAKTTGHEVERVGFCTRDDKIVGCSPDGLIRGADGEWSAGVEVKCPARKTHVGYICEGVLPAAYKQQVHGGMAVTGLDTWHFFSHFPGLAPFHLEVRRDAYTERLSASLDQFLEDYAAMRTRVMPKLMLGRGEA